MTVVVVFRFYNDESDKKSGEEVLDSIPYLSFLKRDLRLLSLVENGFKERRETDPIASFSWK